MPARVLVIDPEKTIANAFARLLGRRGFKATTASNERDAVQHLSESAPDVVVLEPDVRGSWGRKLLSKRGRDIPFIVVSRFKPDDAGQADGVSWYTKPITTEDLVKALDGAHPRHDSLSLERTTTGIRSDPDDCSVS